MFTADFIINAYARNLHFIKQLTDGFTHAESLIQPPAPGNCANWIVGHIAAYRNRILTILEEETTLEPQLALRYARESAPVLGEEPGIARFETLTEAIEAAQPRIAIGIERLTPHHAERIVSYPPMTLSTAEWMVSLLRHEAYHTGQLELLQEVVKANR
jgi:uncharacterized damage-inducible protein DinB